jgi:hypothetical protein
MRRLLALVLLALAPLAGAAPAAAAEEEDPLVIALLDTGINAAHQEFAPDQVVAWWDFTNAEDPPDGGPTRWDPRRGPYDGNGHGTGTAAMAAARNVDPRQTPSFAPGARLAIAKVATDSGAISGNLAHAFRWAVDVAGADVINMSIGTIVPVPGWPFLTADVYRAIDHARAKGVLVTLANGNGTGNAGVVPSTGASSGYSSSLSALAVGASGTDGLTVSWQPEVAAQYRVTAPAKDNADGYRGTAGTSFAAPRVAGFAARLLQEARAHGTELGVERLERLIKYVARDTELPPVTEGYGVIDAAQLATALEHAAAGTLPARPSPDLSGAYVEEVAGRERELNNGVVRPPGAR